MRFVRELLVQELGWLVGWVGVRVLGEAYIYRCF